MAEEVPERRVASVEIHPGGETGQLDMDAAHGAASKPRSAQVGPHRRVSPCSPEMRDGVAATPWDCAERADSQKGLLTICLSECGGPSGGRRGKWPQRAKEGEPHGGHAGKE